MKFKECIDSIKPYVPGKPIDEVKEELGLAEIIKLASNENPLGISPLAREAIKNNIDDLFLYPDGGCCVLRQKLAKRLTVSPDEIVIGNGSNEIIEFIARGFITPGSEVISSQYSFLVYPLLSQVCEGKYVEVSVTDYAYDLGGIADQITDKTSVIFLANPNNPTGTIFTKSDLESFLLKVPEDVIVCLDEAYFDFVENPDYPDGIEYIKKYSNVIVLRTFSKAFGLAGLRVGYGVATKEIISYFNKIRQPFNVNQVAQLAAASVLDDDAYLEDSKNLVKQGKSFLYGEFEKLGVKYIQSETNFILVDVNRDSKVVFEECLAKGIIVRDMKAYKLDNFIRVTIGTEKQNRELIKVLNKIGV